MHAIGFFYLTEGTLFPNFSGTSSVRKVRASLPLYISSEEDSVFQVCTVFFWLVFANGLRRGWFLSLSTLDWSFGSTLLIPLSLGVLISELAPTSGSLMKALPSTGKTRTAVNAAIAAQKTLYCVTSVSP